MKLACVGEMKLSNKFIQLEKKDNSEAKKKGRETTPQRPNDKTVETARTGTPQERMKGEIKYRLIFPKRERRPHHTSGVQGQGCPWQQTGSLVVWNMRGTMWSQKAERCLVLP